MKIEYGDDPLTSLYPISVHQSRYAGTYEGAEWFAVAYTREAPSGAIGQDLEASAFWSSPAAQKIGRGDTPDEAVADLIARNVEVGAVHAYIEHVASLEQILDSIRPTKGFTTVDDFIALMGGDEDDADLDEFLTEDDEEWEEGDDE